MTQFIFANNVQTALSNNISNSATTITLSSTSNFPTIPSGYVWAVTLNDAATQSVFEILYVTAISGANLTVIRGMEGTTARSWLANDFVYAAETAGILASFLQSATGNFVVLSPSGPQTGFINVTGAISAGGLGTFVGVNVGGPLTAATSGTFFGSVSVQKFLATLTYGATTVANLPVRLQGSTGPTGIGASSSLTQRGITATVLAIGASGSANFLALDTTGNVGIAGSLSAGDVNAPTGEFATLTGSNATLTGTIDAYNAAFGNQLNAGVIFQGSNRVVDTITSTDGSLTVVDGGHTINLTLAPTSKIPVGGMIFQNGSGGYAAQTLPSYGTWAIEVIWAMGQSTNNNGTMTITLAGGSVSSTQNSNGYGSQNATFYGLALWSAKANGSQTISWDFNSTEPLDASGWTIKSFRLT